MKSSYEILFFQLGLGLAASSDANYLGSEMNAEVVESEEITGQLLCVLAVHGEKEPPWIRHCLSLERLDVEGVVGQSEELLDCSVEFIGVHYVGQKHIRENEAAVPRCVNSFIKIELKRLNAVGKFGRLLQPIHFPILLAPGHHAGAGVGFCNQ